MSGFDPAIHSPNTSLNRSNEFKSEMENEIMLETEDKLRVIKGMALMIVFWTLIISSIIFYNTPNYNPDIVFEGVHSYDIRMDRHPYNNPIYKLMSKYSRGNYIEFDIALERLGKENPISTNPSQNIKMIIKFAKNRCHIQIKDPEANNLFEIPSTLYNYNDLEMDKVGKIEHMDDSDIGIKIFHHPFGFYLYRKDTEEILFDTTHSVDNVDFNTYMYFAKNYLQISTRLAEGHYTYGLGEDIKSSLRLQNSHYYFWSRDPFNGEVPSLTPEGNTNVYSSFPNFITVNPKTLKSYGVVMFNSSPMEVILDKNYLTYKMSGGIIDMYIFNGPRTKDVVYQQQKTFGMPVLGQFSDMEWGGNVISSNIKDDIKDIADNKIKNKRVFPIESFWIDSKKGEKSEEEIEEEHKKIITDSGYNLNWYMKSPLSTHSKYYGYAKEKNSCLKNEKGELFIGKLPYDNENEYCIIDYYSDNALELRNMIFTDKYNNPKTHLNLMYNEPYIKLNNPETSDLILPLFKDNSSLLLENTIPFSSFEGGDNTDLMLYMHNLYSLQESQIFYNFIQDTNSRPILFSRSTFTGSQQYTGKWLGYIPPTWAGLRYAIKQTMIFNLLGNPNVIHEACGYNEYSSDSEAKFKALELNKEVCIRWLQFSSINIFARVNNWEIFHLLKAQYSNSLKKTIETRQVLNIYIYSYRIKNSIEGGGFILPIFAYCTDFQNEKYEDTLFTLETQFMIGTNLMASPITKPNERKKSTYFPNELFYDFYTGELINPEGEILKEVDAPLDKMPLFARGGFITPIQQSNLDYKNLQEMRYQPIQLLIALDRDYQAQGKLMLDDGISNNKKYYLMDFVALHIEENREINILFKTTKNLYIIENDMYPKINALKIYGIKKMPSRILFDEGSDKEEIELGLDNAEFDYELNVLQINTSNISIKLGNNSKYKLLLKDID